MNDRPECALVTWLRVQLDEDERVAKEQVRRIVKGRTT